MSKSLTGHFLIAIPKLSDPNFFRTAVLLFQHSDSGAAGVVVNRRTNVKICDVSDEFSSLDDNNEHFVFSGGPVAGPVIALHTSLAQAELSVMPGLFLSTDKSHLLELARQNRHPVKFFANYSGWGAGQLEQELEAGGWLTLPATLDDVFQSDPAYLWKSLCDQLGTAIMLPTHSTQLNQAPWNN